MDQKGFCGGCSSDTPLDVGLNDAAINMDREIAHYVYGVAEEVLDVWPFPLPRFSTDKKWALSALDVACRGGTMPSGIEAALCEAVWEVFKVRPAKGELLLFLSALTPQLICRAVLIIARNDQYQEFSLRRDDRLRGIRRVAPREVDTGIR